MDKLIEDIKNALGHIVTLEITTVVGPVAFDPATKTFELDPQGHPKRMRTVIDFLDGHIETELDPEFVTGDYQSLRDYHAQKERQGAAILASNIEVLERLVHLAETLK